MITETLHMRIKASSRTQIEDRVRVVTHEFFGPAVSLGDPNVFVQIVTDAEKAPSGLYYAKAVVQVEKK